MFFIQAILLGVCILNMIASANRKGKRFVQAIGCLGYMAKIAAFVLYIIAMDWS